MSVHQDVRLALRLFRRTPFVTAIVLISIAFSVGATAVIFTAIKSVLIDPLPYARPGELVQIRTEWPNFDPSMTHADYVLGSDPKEIARRTRTLESLGTYGNALSNLAGDASTPPEALYGLRVSASLFPTLGVTPMLGRNILPEEDQIGHAEVMILSYGLWKRRFNADPNVVGGNITINGHDCLVIGVMAPEFNFPYRRAAAHTPSPYIEFWSAMLASGPANPRGAVGLVARLRPGVSVAEAGQDLESIDTALSRESPATNRDRALRLGLLEERQLGNARSTLWFLMAASVMFSLIGCANVANLLLARGMVRHREIAIRIAIGAGRGRIVRQLLTESCVLAIFGGVAGYLLTVVAWKIVPVLAPVSIPRLASGRAGWTILGFALVVALINGVLFGMAPALRAAGTRVVGTNDFGAATATSQGKMLRTSLVAGEVAISVVLVVVGAQLIGTFARLLGTNPGFQADHILASVVIPGGDEHRTPEAQALARALLYRKFLDSIRALPGVESVGAVDALPFSGENHGGSATGNENDVMEPRNQSTAEIDVVSSDYLQTMGARLLEGRWFSEDDMKSSSDSAIVNDVVAAGLWPGMDPIGKRICIFCTPEKPNNWKQVVGVVSSMRHMSMEEAHDQQANIYVASGALEKAAFLVARINRPARDLETAIRRAIAKVDPNQPVFYSAPLRSLIADSLAGRRFVMSLLAVTGLLALVMSMAGVYGVSSYVTSQRSHEIGVRIALGATPGNVLGLIFRHGFLTAALGLGIGLCCTMLVLRVVRGMLAGLESAIPGYVVIGVILVTLTAAFACLLPAQRAAKIEPMSALRQE